jgi:hypothetical protein
MKKKLLLFALAACAFNVHGQQPNNAIQKNIPSLESVSGVWINADTIGIEPSVRNFRAQALLDRDMTSLSWFASTPYSGGYHSGVLRVNGKAPIAQLLRWYPWQGLRKATEPTYKVATAVRMIPENNGIMWEITLTNSTKKSQHYDVKQDMIGFISHYAKDEWPWKYPYPTLHGKTVERDDEIVNVRNNIGKDPKDFVTTHSDQNDKSYDPNKPASSWPKDDEILSGSKYHIASYTKNQFIVADNETDALIGYHIMDEPDKLMLQNSGATAVWKFDLKPGSTKTIRFFMTWGDNNGDIQANLNKWANNFNQTYAGVEKTWKDRWQEMFKPHNKLFSGTFPVLASNDKTVNKIYYEGPLTVLYLLNTNLPLQKRVVLTGGPRWGASIDFFWDEAEWSQIYAMVDPEVMRSQLKLFIERVNPDKYFGLDFYSGKGQGNGYVSNYWAIFQLIRSYITMTKDYAFLNEVVGDKKVIDHLYDYAYNWKKLSIYGQPGATDDTYKLADFGSDPWNLLECVPTYIHIVPSFNAQYVWMMRETAKFYEMGGEHDKAAKIKTDADEMMQRVLKLYAGDGVWNALYPDGKKVQLRHVLDFMYVSKYVAPDLSPKMRKEMVDFAERELITDKWMRAQSIKDPAANASDRPDHGPLGAYDGWPPGTMDALVQLGYSQKALNFYRSVLPVTVEGNWSQSHELWGDNKFNKKGRVRIDERGWNCRDAAAGIDFSQVILKCFMGFDPAINGSILKPTQKVDFSGTLYHVLYGGKYYTVTYKNNKTVMKAE